MYEDEDDPRMVIKVLHPDRATPERAEKLRAMRDNLPPNAQTLGWPNLVQSEISKKELRYRMPRAPGWKSARRTGSSAPTNGEQLPPHLQEYEHRTKLGVKIAEAFRQLHTIHVRIGDVNPLNILVSDDGSVMLIDCDSFQIPHPSGGQPYPCVVGSPEYTAPEIDDFRRQFRSQDSDNFALAVLLYQLLGDGSHPYQGIDERSDDSVSGIRARIKEHRFAHQPGNNRWHPTLPDSYEAGRLCPHRCGMPFMHGLFRGCQRDWAARRGRLGQHTGAESIPGCGRRKPAGAPARPDAARRRRCRKEREESHHPNRGRPRYRRSRP